MTLLASTLLWVSLGLFAQDQPKPAVGTSEVPFRLADTAIIVDATVNGKNVSLMFDTGFSATVIVDDTLNIGPISGTTSLIDFVGRFQAKTVKIKSLKVGAHDITPKDQEAILEPGQRGITEVYNQHVDGLLGLRAMDGQVLEINFEKRKFIFHPASTDISKWVPDNKKTFLAKMLPIGIDSVEMAVTAPSGKTMVLALDTGNSFYATTHTEVLERVGAWTSGQKPKFVKKSGVASGAVDSFTKKMAGMTIFGVPVATSYWDIIDAPSAVAGQDGTVGFGFLSNFNIVIDYARRRVWFENFTGKTGNMEPGDVGISMQVHPIEKRIVVTAVSPDSPADKAGVKRGDFVLAIDGKDLPPNLGFAELRRRLEGTPGTKVKIDLSRDGALVRVELTRVCLAND